MSSQRVIAASILIAFTVGNLEGCAPANVRQTGPSGSNVAASPAGEGWNAVQLSDPCSESAKTDQQIGSTLLGGVAGALAGALLGAIVDQMTGDRSRTATRAGAIAGAGLGIYIGYNKGSDGARRQCELYQAAQATSTQAAFVSLQQGSGDAKKTGEVTITPDQGHFFDGSDQLTPAGKAYYAALAAQYTEAGQRESFERTVRNVAKKDARTATHGDYTMGDRQKAEYEAQWAQFRIVLTGHTDDSGDPDAQLALSEGRAKSVAQIFREAGIPDGQLLFHGAGAAYPIADNNSAEGRAKNGRVEIVVLFSDAAVQKYADARDSKYEYFRPIEQQTPTQDAVPQSVPISGAAPVAPPPVAPPPKRTSKPNVSRPTTSKRAPKVETTAQDTQETKPNIFPVVGAPPRQIEEGIDFGGAPVTPALVSLAEKIGPLKARADGFSIAGLFGVGAATAYSTAPVASCMYDNPQRYSPGVIKRFSDGSEAAKKSALYYLDLKNLRINGRAGDHQVELRGITALATGELAKNPSFQVYKSFFSKSSSEQGQAKPDLTILGPAIAFRGEKGLLLRQFLNGEQGLQCIDVIFPSDPVKSGFRMDDVALIYRHQQTSKIARPQLM